MRVTDDAGIVGGLPTFTNGAEIVPLLSSIVLRTRFLHLFIIATIVLQCLPSTSWFTFFN